jgi:hypothetical protein
MRKRILIGMMVLVFMATIMTSGWAEEWAIKAEYAESCCCLPTCPCYFGSPPTHGHCDGIMLTEINEGHYGNTRLDGITVVTVLRLGEWVEFYVSENATDDQVKAAQKLMEIVLAEDFPPGTEFLSTEKASVSVERTATTLKFSIPTSIVEIEVMEGQDGKAIKIQNLPFVGATEFTQYKAIKLSHNSKNKKFSYSGTNGYTAKMEATSKK